MRVVRDSAGQATIEWTGAVVVVVALALALAALSPQVVHDVMAALRAGPISRGAPWDSPDPVRRATWGTYVSLGDSYSAGEGLGDYQAGSHVVAPRCRVSILGHCLLHKRPKVLNGCDRSSGAYNATVSGTYDFDGGKRTWACSGAITRDVYDGPGDPSCRHGHASGSYGEGCQVNRVNARTSLVTMTIGGNDAGFADDLKTCYVAERPGGPHEAGCAGQRAAIDARIAAIPGRLVAGLQAIHARARHARIIVLTYPRPFANDPTKRAGCVWHLCLSPGDQRFLNDEARKLDDTICGAVAAAGVGAECVDAYDAFDGCEIGRPGGCLQAPTAHLSASTVIGINSGAYHPTAKGQRILGELANRQIAHPTDPPPR